MRDREQSTEKKKKNKSLMKDEEKKRAFYTNATTKPFQATDYRAARNVDEYTELHTVQE